MFSYCVCTTPILPGRTNSYHHILYTNRDRDCLQATVHFVDPTVLGLL